MKAQQSPNVSDYLKRIKYDGPLDGSANMLARLQASHLHTVPYENLDILDQVPLSLAIPDVFDKIVTRGRGGYCFELNALFGWLLRELGYSVTDYFARFWRDETDLPPKRRHHVLQVETEGKLYLCDVGVGGIIPKRPIEMVERLEQRQGEECYQLVRDSQFGWVLQEWKKDQWQRLYSFSEEPQLPRDFLMANYWCENSPDSIFTKTVMLSVFTENGRNTVAGEEFRLFTDQGVQTFTPANNEEYTQALKTYFGIVR
ncbi:MULTISPECIES: arylamine N-acetyltransferase family protein [Gracilibacillus]|uniref:arylamine N-acetyltransferase family protein n=1 Tax=Gracilibacillus TaxID=74385 RepID=UPI000826AA2F|nr:MULTISPECIES: arylamine N-acetyltransferase [Gracilibacillus]